jgi:hypothetical protein
MAFCRDSYSPSSLFQRCARRTFFTRTLLPLPLPGPRPPQPRGTRGRVEGDGPRQAHRGTDPPVLDSCHAGPTPSLPAISTPLPPKPTRAACCRHPLSRLRGPGPPRSETDGLRFTGQATPQNAERRRIKSPCEPLGSENIFWRASQQPPPLPVHRHRRRSPVRASLPVAGVPGSGPSSGFGHWVGSAWKGRNMDGVAKPSTSSGSGVTDSASAAAASIDERFADLCEVRPLTRRGDCAAPLGRGFRISTFRWGAGNSSFFFLRKAWFFLLHWPCLGAPSCVFLSRFSRSELMDLAPPPLLLHLLFFLGNVSAFLPVVRSSGFCHFDCAIARFCLDFPNQFLACLTLITIR